MTEIMIGLHYCDSQSRPQTPPPKGGKGLGTLAPILGSASSAIVIIYIGLY